MSSNLSHGSALDLDFNPNGIFKTSKESVDQQTDYEKEWEEVLNQIRQSIVGSSDDNDEHMSYGTYMVDEDTVTSEYMTRLKVPKSYKEALKHLESDKWNSGMQDEIARLLEKEVFVYIEELPPGKHAILSRWVYTYKRNEHGIIVRWKCRLVAKGYAQVPGLDY